MSGNINGMIVDNPSGVNLGGARGLGGELIIEQGGFVDGSKRLLQLGGTSKITNNMDETAFHNIELKTYSGDYRYLEVYGDTLTHFPYMSFDQRVYFSVYTDMKINKLASNHQGEFSMYGADLILEVGTSGFAASKQYPVYLNDSSRLILEIDSAMLNDTLDMSKFYHDGNGLNAEFSINEGVIDSGAAFILDFQRAISPNQPDPSNTVAFYVQIDTMNMSDIKYNLNFAYAAGDVIGNPVSFEAGIYNEGAWDTSGVSFNSVARLISASGLTGGGELAVGDYYVLPVPAEEDKSPANAATLVNPDAEVFVNFDKDITAGTSFGSITMDGTLSGSITGVSGSIINDTLIISHSDFQLNEEVTVTVPIGAVANVEGKEIVSAISWTFTVTSVGIESTGKGSIVVTPTVSDGYIEVKNAVGEEIEVISILGSTELSTVASSNNEIIDLSGKSGVYLVRVGSIVTKVVVQ
jgi:hypothetical protein